MRRIRSDAAATMLGITARGVQAMAARGDLPGAAKVGKVWTFDQDKLKRHIAALEAECVLKNTSGYERRAATIGCAAPSRADNIEKAYAQTISRLLSGGAIKGSRK